MKNAGFNNIYIINSSETLELSYNLPLLRFHSSRHCFIKGGRDHRFGGLRE